MNKKRTFVLFCVLALVAAAAVGGWQLGTRIESPAEAAARTAPPEPSPILHEVKRRTLTETIVTRGTARFGLPQPISIAPSGLKTKPGLITTLPTLNMQMDEGDVLLTASGRPVLLMQGDTPAYRDMVPGVSGQDVRQLEEGLARLGFDPGEADGKYDERTCAAVAKWYEAAGWEPFGPTPEQLVAIRDLEKQLGDATKAKLTAESAVATAELAVASAGSKAEHDNKLAAADVEAKLAALEKAKVDLLNAEAALAASRITAQHKTAVAKAELAKAKYERARLVAESEEGMSLAVEAAQAIAEHANRAAKADVAAKIYDRALIVLDPRQTKTARDAADANLEVARAAQFKTELEGELALHIAKRDSAGAKETFGLAEAAVKSAELEGEASIRSAEIAIESAKHQIKVAEQQLELARSAVSSTKLAGEEAARIAADALKLAKFDVELTSKRERQIASDLQLAESKLGVQVPVDEIVFIPALPVRVHELSKVVGDQASGPMLAVTDNLLSIDAPLPLDGPLKVWPGMPVSVDEDLLGIEENGEVDFVAQTPGTHGMDGYHVYMRVRVDKPTVPLAGSSLRLTIPVESTDGSVLTVPMSAVTRVADGSLRIQVKRGDELEYLTVKVGMNADGYAEVLPIDGELNEGDLVVTGFERRDESAADAAAAAGNEEQPKL